MVMTQSETSPPEQKKSEFYEPYAAFARTLRAWLVAYGIGAPVLFSSQDAFSRVLKDAEATAPIMVLFFVGVSLQVFDALSHKYCMFYLYCGEDSESFKQTLRYRLSDIYSEQTWIEILIDFATIGCFALATYRLLSLYVSTA